MPLFPVNSGTEMKLDAQENDEEKSPGAPSPVSLPASIQVKNRRKRYIDTHPEYFSSGLELADPLLYDRLIRRFQTPAEREEEGRTKGYSGVLETDLWRSEAKIQALAHPDPNSSFSYKRGPNGEILAEEQDEIPEDKEEGEKRWHWEMEMRFIRGGDTDFDYKLVDENDDYDDWSEEQERYFDEETPEWLVEGDQTGEADSKLQGETGIQDF